MIRPQAAPACEVIPCAVIAPRLAPSLRRHAPYGSCMVTDTQIDVSKTQRVEGDVGDISHVEMPQIGRNYAPIEIKLLLTRIGGIGDVYGVSSFFSTYITREEERERDRGNKAQKSWKTPTTSPTPPTRPSKGSAVRSRSAHGSPLHVSMTVELCTQRPGDD